jgi:hypothetical protein
MRSQDLKYLGYGIGMGVLIASLFLLAFVMIPGNTLFEKPVTSTSIPSTPTFTLQPSPTITQVPTGTFTPTPTMLPSSTPIPTITLTLTSMELLIASGEIALKGPLTKEQQISLYEASLSFISPTSEESRQTSLLITGVPYSDASTICGPLTIALLQRAKLIPEELTPYDFFLLDPDLPKDRQLLSTALPKNSYNSIRHRTRLNQFNWSLDPLLPGDFVYIYAGSQGNFEHILVVNRVDYRGRAYSVTNYNTVEGFVINEVMLYDPVDPTAGIFAQWAKRERQTLGSTGFEGFEVWRRKE